MQKCKLITEGCDHLNILVKYSITKMGKRDHMYLFQYDAV